PADAALECAAALREAFQGRSVPAAEITASQAGFVSTGELDQQKREIAFVVPGPAVECSVGIAIAHFKSPLQDVVRAAQAAEKRAKQFPGKAAVAVSLFKRSGETIEWGCKWADGGLEAYRTMADALAKDVISSKLPYR